MTDDDKNVTDQTDVPSGNDGDAHWVIAIHSDRNVLSPEATLEGLAA